MATKAQLQTPNGKQAIINAYGNPTNASGKLSQVWREQNIVPVTLPFPMRVAWEMHNTVTRISMHRDAAAPLVAALTDVWNHARGEVKKKHGYDKTTEFYDKLTLDYLRALNLDLYGGGFNYRLKRGSASSLSVHSWGVAIDIDPAHNALGDDTPAMPLWVVAIFEKHGWTWGGRFKGRKDGMHFQYCRGY